MKTLFVLGLAALLPGGLRAADSTPAPDASPTLAPTADQGFKGRHCPRGEMKGGRDRQDSCAMKGDRTTDRGDRGEHGGKPMGHSEKMKGCLGGMANENDWGNGGHAKAMAGGHPLAHALHLTDDQKTKMKEIVAAAKPKLEAIRAEGREKMKAVMQDTANQLRPLLTPEQQAVFDDLQRLKTDRAALKSMPSSTPEPKDE